VRPAAATRALGEAGDGFAEGFGVGAAAPNPHLADRAADPVTHKQRFRLALAGGQPRGDREVVASAQFVLAPVAAAPAGVPSSSWAATTSRT
jgi:hypothetical protein